MAYRQQHKTVMSDMFMLVKASVLCIPLLLAGHFFAGHTRYKYSCNSAMVLLYPAAFKIILYFMSESVACYIKGLYNNR